MIDVTHPSCEQYEACLQSGNGMPVYSGTIMQRGYGVGGLFRRLASGILPLLPTIGKAALGVASDKMSGIPLSKALQKRSLAAGKELLVRSTRRKRNKTTKRKPVVRSRKSDVFGSK